MDQPGATPEIDPQVDLGTVGNVGTASTMQLVQAAAAIAAELAARQAPESGAACLELAESVARVIDLQEAALAGFIETVDRTGEMGRWGFPSAKAWLRTRCQMRPGRAAERLTLARALPRLECTAKRFATGELSYGYAATIAAAVARLNDQDCEKAEQILVEMCGKGVSAGKVAVAGNRIIDLIAERDGTEKPPAEVARGYDRSWVEGGRSLDGGKYFNAWLNEEDAALVDGVLGPLAVPAGPDDRRDLAERTAAALISVLAGGHTNTRVMVLVDLDTLTGGTTPARLPDGTPIPAAQARRIALNAGVSPLLLGAGHVPLYLGQRVRFATTRQRQVLQALYPACVVEGCEVPGALCEVDHVRGWALGGGTDIDQLTLCCGWHNRFKHTNPQQIHITTGGDGLYTYQILPPNDSWTSTSTTTGGGATTGARAWAQDPRPPPEWTPARE